MMSMPSRNSCASRIANASFAFVTIAMLFVGCSDTNTSTKTDQRLLVIDGIEITFADLQLYVDFLTESRPEAGTKTKYLWAMRDHVLPLKVAQREFPKERAEQRKLADALRSVSTNIYELEQQAKLITNKTRSNLSRQSAMLPVSMWLFDELNTNAVSPPIELAQGYFVVSSFTLNKSPLVMADFVDALQVGFITHNSKEWREWWENQKLTLGKKVTFVHPDYRDDIPPWMELPKDNKS